ncbi:MAG: hypothetical protein J5615_06715 [Fibrobacter sp.]|jgi:hypothetical protein|nr:hypothetical protein [Fibrobacter sp.]
MNRLLVLFLCFAAMLLVACGGTRLNVDPTWTEKPKSLTVLITEPYVANTDDLEDDLPEYTTKFGEWMASQLQMELRLRTGLNAEMRIEKDENFAFAQLPIGKNMVDFQLPNPEKIKGLHGMVLTVHPIQFWRDMAPCVGQGGCLNNKYLMAKGTYVFTDVDSRRIMGHGVFGVSSSFSFAMTKGNWEDVVKSMAKEIIEDTPLE